MVDKTQTIGNDRKEVEGVKSKSKMETYLVLSSFRDSERPKSEPIGINAEFKCSNVTKALRFTQRKNGDTEDI